VEFSLHLMTPVSMKFASDPVASRHVENAPLSQYAQDSKPPTAKPHPERLSNGLNYCVKGTYKLDRLKRIFGYAPGCESQPCPGTIYRR
jgi:hypothetical protein